jgi:hypothetical protein
MLHKFENFAQFYDFILVNYEFFQSNPKIEYFKWLGDNLNQCSCTIQNKIGEMQNIYLDLQNILTEEGFSYIKQRINAETLEFWNNEVFIFQK